MRHPLRRALWLGPLTVLALVALSATEARAQSAGRTSAPYHYAPALMSTAAMSTAAQPAAPAAMAQPSAGRTSAPYYYPPANFYRPTSPAATPATRRVLDRLRPLSDEYGPKHDYHYKS